MGAERHEWFEDPIETYWSVHGRARPHQKAFDWYEERKASEDPWCNGRIAVASIVLGLIALLLLTIPVDASHKKSHKGTRVQAIEQREPEPAKGCLKPVRVVGSQWATEGGAEESAQKAWAEAVRFSHGEAYMDLSNATQYQKRCSRSSIQEVAGQSLHRCEVDAVPCRPPFSAGAP